MMARWRLAAAMLGVGLFLGASGQALADSMCTAYDTNNGGNGTGDTPYTYVGYIGSSTCQIGAAPNTAGVTDVADISSSSNPSIYEFYFAGGTLTIEEYLGNQGTGTPIDVELDSLGASQGGTSPTMLYSIPLPYQSGPGGTGTIDTGNLGAGYYLVSSYFASAGTTDPQYELFINDAPAVPTPEPGSGLLLGIGMIGICGMAFMRRRAFSF